MLLKSKMLKDKRLTVSESVLIHKIHTDKASHNYIKLEADYTKLHHLYNIEKNPSRKKKLLKQLESAHKVISKHRKNMLKNTKHHKLLHKIHETKDKNELQKKIHKEHSINNTEKEYSTDKIDKIKEKERITTLKHIVPPVKSHVFQDLGRGLKSVGVGLGQLAGAGAFKLGTSLSNLASKIMNDKKSNDRPNIDFTEDIRG